MRPRPDLSSLASVIVTALASAFGTVLLAATGYLAAVLRADPAYGGTDTLEHVVALLGALLIAVAAYVAGVVTTGTFAAVVAGRVRTIALRRLLGSSARSERRRVAREGLATGAAGAAVGLAAGVGFAHVGGAVARNAFGPVAYTVLQPALALPAVAVALTTWAAAWMGSRRVLEVTPTQALGAAVESGREEVRRRRGRHIVAAVLSGAGAAVLAGGVVLGLSDAAGVVVAFVGGVLSFTGVVLSSAVLLPPVLRATGRLFGRSAVARLAAANATRHPERSARMTVGVMIGVTLVTLFAVAVESTRAVLTATSGGALPDDIAALLDTVSAVVIAIVGFSGVIAGVGLVNLLALGVAQRRRELGLLRALGLSAVQARRMVLLEAAQVTVAALAAGLVLGVVYGWAGAQSLLGSVPTEPAMGPVATFVPPAVPLGPLALVVAATAALTLIAAAAPARAATRAGAVEAL